MSPRLKIKYEISLIAEEYRVSPNLTLILNGIKISSNAPRVFPPTYNSNQFIPKHFPVIIIIRTIYARKCPQISPGRAGVFAGGYCVWVVFFVGLYVFILWVGLLSLGVPVMERNFPVESKSFSISVLEGASTVRVEEKRKNFFRAIILSTQCSDWLASTLETLLDFPEVQDFVKSFREGSKLVTARRGENKAGRYLETTVYGLGGRKGFILIPEGRRGWGWRKFSGELRLVSASLSALVDRGIISFDASVKQNRPSYAAVLRSALVSVAKELIFEGDRLSSLRAPLAEPRALDLLPALRSDEP